MAKNFKNRDPNMKISVYLIHTRLLAQSTVIGKRSKKILVVHSSSVFRSFELGNDFSNVQQMVRKKGEGGGFVIKSKNSVKNVRI